ncbi:hypothetical protein An16g05610 [Aspergillus niger]|uniref:Uncharacterized protein n=2 Tax=Aspergillus niger TaxID=5061 RepID=A2R827_ASPNC|nr:hypothetical protein An16g05610 [Aspergillus niger]CAK46901.1 hypothetical protein An16g05610 [Aspergillus niger]
MDPSLLFPTIFYPGRRQRQQQQQPLPTIGSSIGGGGLDHGHREACDSSSSS